MKEEFRPAIDAAETELRDLQRKTAETKKMINKLYEFSGETAPYTEVDEAEHRFVGTIRADQFYGKTVTRASREYLEIRKVSNRGPATPREIYDALREGGFSFEAKNDINAMVGLRQSLRKNSAIFHRLPQGQYGLLAWYPNAKNSKPSGEGDDASAKATTRQSTPRKRRRLKKSASTGVKQGSGDVPLTNKVIEVMGNGADWTIERLKQEFPSVGGRALQGALMSLKGRGRVANVERGVWRIVAEGPASAESQDEPEAAADIPSAAA